MSSSALLADEHGNEERICRVCHETECDSDLGPLITPCRCAGSMRWVHQQCLHQWRVNRLGLLALQSRCEICGFNYRYESVQASRLGSCLRLCWKALPQLAVLILMFVAVVSAKRSVYAGLLFVAAAIGLRGVFDVMRVLWLWRRFSKYGDGASLPPLTASVLLVFGTGLEHSAQQRAEELQKIVQSRAAAHAEWQAGRENVYAARAAGIPDADADTDAGGDMSALAACVVGCCCSVLLLVLVLMFVASHVTPWMVQDAQHALAALGTIYVVGSAVVTLYFICRSPPLVMKRGHLGLALVRSISDDERSDVT
eukprot:TRINITY_DN74858_c0_g1_i1.p1 TRINITY_DN74858_c0_g1~~TRINITY_DN74858_c0_g1_i1.p1  ORF type:complete len:312 (+),score=45.66 TRINITY_DN74858_c0_g1_i1:40-975(+)